MLKNAVDTVVYESNSVEEVPSVYAPYNKLELARIFSVLDVFIERFKSFRLSYERRSDSFDQDVLIEYVCNFLQNDLPYSLRMRVNLDEVNDYFRIKKCSIYLVAMPRCTFQSIKGHGFILERNGKGVDYGLSVAFDQTWLDYCFDKACLDERSNRLKLRECGFYISIPLS